MRHWSIVVIGLVLACAGVRFAEADVIYLDADTPSTGSELDVSPLMTKYGTISFYGTIRSVGSDTEFLNAGATGDAFDITTTSGQNWARMTFGFPVDEINFIFGGNSTYLDLRAYNAAGTEVASMPFADTGNGQFAGPAILAPVDPVANPIRWIEWKDAFGKQYAVMENLYLTVNAVALGDFDPYPLPEPSACTLLALAGVGLATFCRRRRRRTA